MTRGTFAAVAIAVVAMAGLGRSVQTHLAAAAAEDERLRVPVVVELFTSEGCSSCPPADSLLTKLVATQPVQGARVIALGEHVDYWDRLGWRDPFSSAAFTARQSDYARSLGSSDIYTPQMVVNGGAAVIGSDAAAAAGAIAKAAQDARRVKVEVATLDGVSPPRAWIRLEPRDGSTFAADLDVVLAVTEDGLSTVVKRGENRGRTLQHTAVTRSLDRIASVGKGSPAWSTTHPLSVGADWKHEHLTIVAFVRDRTTHQIVGADSLALDAGR